MGLAATDADRNVFETPCCSAQCAPSFYSRYDTYFTCVHNFPLTYSIFSVARNALSYHETWPLAWRSPKPKPRYDAVIIGGGGHGLATAYYLAREHGITRAAVLEKGWIGGGNTGRNTT